MGDSDYWSMGGLIRDLGERALKTMTLEELEAVALGIRTTESVSFNLSRLVEGFGSLIAQDAAAERRSSSGALQGADSIAVFSVIAEGIDTIASVTYLSSFAMHKMLRPEAYGGPLEGKHHG